MIKEDFSLNVSSRTVQRRLSDKGLRSYFTKKKPFISAKNKKARLAFAKLHFHKTQSFWESIIWSDESKFELKNTKRRKRVWCRPNERLQSKNIVKTTKYGGGSIMVWGCFSKKGVGNITKIDEKMTGASYVNIIRENLNDSIHKIGLATSFSNMTMILNIRQGLQRRILSKVLFQNLTGLPNHLILTQLNTYGLYWMIEFQWNLG